MVGPTMILLKKNIPLENRITVNTSNKLSLIVCRFRIVCKTENKKDILIFHIRSINHYAYDDK